MSNKYLPEGSLILTPENREYLSCIASLERAIANHAILEGMVTLCDEKMRLHVDLGCAQGIVEPEEALYRREGESRKDIAIISRVGKPIAFCVRSLEAENGRYVATLSRRDAQIRCIRYAMESLRPGDVIPSRVTHLEPFGAFLDIGCGVASLLSVDCISVSRISHPRDRLRPGMNLPVVVKTIDTENGRVYVTLRELLGTWEENAAGFEVGQTVTGIIRSVEGYGVFVELAPNLAGLAELRDGCAAELRERIGQSVAVYIKSIVPNRMKIKLILIDTCGKESTPKDLKFYVDPQRTLHLSRWCYSPADCTRRVETVFD